MYFLGKGNLYVAARDANGDPGVFTDLLECPVFELEPQVTYVDNVKTSKSGPNEQDMHLEVTRKLTGSLQMKEPTVANLVHILHGESATDTGASYTGNAALPSGLVVGDIVHLPGDHVGISSLVLKDSTGSPVTLTLGTHYSLWDADAALVKILSLTTITQPIKAFSYTYKDSTDVKILTKAVANKCLYFSGVNLADLDTAGLPKPIICQLHNVSIEPAAKVGLKSEDFDMYEMKFTALIDPLKAVSTSLGRFGWIRHPVSAT
jgi:hypothetical protein